jgi:hypothetical protein
LSKEQKLADFIRKWENDAESLLKEVEKNGITNKLESVQTANK